MPSIESHPCEELDELLEIPYPLIGKCERIQSTLRAAEALKSLCPDSQVRVPMCGPFALAGGLVGISEVLMGIIEDENLTLDALSRGLGFLTNYMDAMQERGLEPIIFESGVSPPLLPVERFAQFEKPLLEQLFAHAAKRFDSRPACIIGGDSAPLAPDLFAMQPGYLIAPSETDQETFLAARQNPEATHVRINMSASVLGSPNFRPIEAELVRVSAIARDHENVSIGCGVVPAECPPQQITMVREWIQNHS